MTQQRIVVVGGGLSGVCTAYFLARAGFDVAVIERRNNVAEEATLGNSGLIAPAAISPLAAPGMARQTFLSRFQAESALVMPKGIDPALWRWLRRWRLECQADRHLANKRRITRLAAYGQELLHQLQHLYALDHENSPGVLRIFRTAQERELALAQSEILTALDLAHAPLDAEQLRAHEPTLVHIPAAGGMLYANDETGNCVLFAKQIKAAAQNMGVQFHFGHAVTALRPELQGIRIDIAGTPFSADAVVVCAGMQSAALLKPLGLTLPLYPVQSYSALAHIKNPEHAPSSALIDDHYRLSIATIGSRIRIAGLTGFVPYSEVVHEKALRTMLKVAEEYFPDAANYNTAQFWSNTFAATPTGAPLLGATAQSGVYLNVGHGASGWAGALGGARLLADRIAGVTSEIDSADLLVAQ